VEVLVGQQSGETAIKMGMNPTAGFVPIKIGKKAGAGGIKGERGAFSQFRDAGDQTKKQ